MDILGPVHILNTPNKFFIVIVDYNSHWTMFKQVQNITTKVVIEFLKECFCKEGIPTTIITDNGVQFTSEEIRSFFKDLGIQHNKVALYCPRANGLVERTNKLFKECIQSAVRNGVVVEGLLREKLWAFHTAPNLTTGISPFLALKGRNPSTKLVPGWLGGGERASVDQEMCKRKVCANQSRYKSWYDHKYSTKSQTWKPGDWAWVKMPNRQISTTSKFYDPIKIVVVRGNVVKTEDNRWWSMDRLVKCRDKDNDIPAPNRDQNSEGLNSQGLPCKGVSEEEESVLVNRTRRVPKWHKDYVMH